jgi:predicted GH43/DUF377 family glycosyl hydrolase
MFVSKKQLLLRTVFLLLLLPALMGCSTAPNQDEPESTEEVSTDEETTVKAENRIAQPFSGELTTYSTEPVFQNGLDRTWDQAIVDVGAVVYHGGLFHLFYNGTQNYTMNRGGSYDVAFQRSSVGYAVSANGYDWYRMGDSPILTLENTEMSIFNARVSSAVVLDDGTWVMYLYAQNNDFGFPPGSILRASAPAPEGPWHFDDVPVLEPGGAGTWDGYAVRFPDVSQVDDGFVMYYVGLSDRIGFGRGLVMMGVATSSDGISWTKHDDPTTEDGTYRESDPIFSLDAAPWGRSSFRIQRVWQTSAGWEMIYSAASDYFASPLFGYATSADGINWSFGSDAPIWTPENIRGVTALGFAEILYYNGEYYFYFNATKDNFSGDVYLAIAE